jgi:hypothetical protein
VRVGGRQALIPVEEVLGAIVDLADDGFCARRELALRFRGKGEREIRRSIARAARQGLVLERRGPDTRSYLAVSSEGWDLIRSADLGSKN